MKSRFSLVVFSLLLPSSVLFVPCLLGAAGCKGILLKDNYYGCEPGTSGACPRGMTCVWSNEAREYRCVARVGSDAGADAAGSDCGNGVLDRDEQCDGQDLGGQTCEGLGHSGGQLACTAVCTYDRSGCDPVSTCGDGDVDPPAEECDGSDLGGATCESLGYAGGVLGCLANCTYDTGDCHVTPVCGNGLTETGEQCDDGNQDNTDDCPDDAANGGTCMFAFCGDGFLQSGQEECDHGAGNSDLTPNACRTNCTEPVCGDGVPDNLYAEECDQGVAMPTSTCNSDCTDAACGNGVVDDVEVCDDGNQDNSDSCPDYTANGGTCQNAFCGDGFVWTSQEECDDGGNNSNTVPDACRLDCRDPWCGDNVMDTGEECDPPNGSTCDNTCHTIEPVDPNGYYPIAPHVSYSCAMAYVSLIYSMLGFWDDGSTLVVDPSMNGCCDMTGPSASGGSIDVTCTCPGICDETYTLAGGFIDNDTWQATLTATFSGQCMDCTNQTWNLTGTRQ